MFRKILVPLDGSTFAEAALPLALEVARAAEGETRLVLVRELDPQIDFQVWAPLADDWSQSYLLSLGKHLEEQSHRDVSTRVLSGHVVDAVEEAAKEWGADLVVMASHGRGGVSRAWLGSVTDSFVRHTSRPVLVVRSREPEDREEAAASKSIRRILIPLDGSEVSESILPPAQAMGTMFGASFHLVRIVPFPRAPTSSYMPHAAEVNRERVAEAEDEAGAYLAGKVAAFADAGLEATSATVVVSQVARGVLSEAADAECDVIAMATHGRGILRRALMGSTTDKVLRATDRTLLLLRPSATDG